MAYSEFSLAKVQSDFSLYINERVDLFAGVEAVAPTDLLRLTLKETIPLVSAINTEKARSELIIAPVLLEVRALLYLEW